MYVPVSSSVADAPQLLPNASLSLDCLTFRTSMVVFTAFSVTNILLILPLSVLVLCLGFQRWRHQHYSSTPAAATSHSDVFTYHMVAMEIIMVLGCFFYTVGVHASLQQMFTYGFFVFFSPWCVKTHFHSLTCVEYYLAVVHPITYRSLKSTGGVRIRNITTGCIWLLCCLWANFFCQTNMTLRITIYFCLELMSLFIISFCCISVLCALKRPGPGVDQMKQRAFNTLVTINGVLWLGLVGMLVCNSIVESHVVSESANCVLRMVAVWFSLPSSLVLPLLYLHRAGKPSR